MTPERLIHKTGLATLDITELANYYLHQAAIRWRCALSTIPSLPSGICYGCRAALLGLDELPYADIRHWHINGFERLLILYRETTDGIEVVRVLHSARDLTASLQDHRG